MTVVIGKEYEGRLLRSYLKLTLGLSTAVLSKLKNREDGILVNGRRVTVRYVLHEGDVITLGDRDTPETATERVIPVELPLEVLYEDDYVIALTKPADMPTHPSHGHLCDTLANALAYRYREADEPFVFRPLGRLDRNTSGVVVAAKTRAAAGCLSRALQRGLVRKRYVAIVAGEMPVDGIEHLLSAPMYRPDAVGIRRAVAVPEEAETVGAVEAVTRYRVLAAGGGLSLVLCEPLTGRTHQLRVHLAHLGYPILGDDIYGTPSPCIGRQALHALSLSVPLPFAADLRSLSPPMPPADGQSFPVNEPSSDGYLHTLAPLPADMAAVAAEHFPAWRLLPDALPTLLWRFGTVSDGVPAHPSCPFESST